MCIDDDVLNHFFYLNNIPVIILEMETYSKDELKKLLKNKTQGIKTFRQHLSQLPFQIKFEDKLILSILQYHPDFEKRDIQNLQYMIIDQHPIFFNSNALFIKTTNRERDTISHIACIENLFGKYDIAKKHLQHINQAFRTAVFDTKRKCFKRNSPEICELCASTEDLTIDHFPSPFSQILQQFLTNENIDFQTIEIEYFNKLPYLQDPELFLKFNEYHDKVAHFRKLCRKCNSKLGTHNV
jgi:hypothetical protein